MGGKSSSIISIIFKLLSFHATECGWIWLVNVSESLFCCLPLHNPRGVSGKNVKQRLKRYVQVAQQAERPQKVQLLPSQSIQTLKKFFHWRKGEMGNVENDQQKWEDKMVIKKWKYKKTCYQIIRTKEMISSEKKWDIFLLNGCTVQNLGIWTLSKYSANSRFLSYTANLCWMELNF